MKKIVVIGNGIAGATAAIEIRKRTNDAITIISPESEYFFSRTAMMYVYMGHMKFEHTKPYEDWFWKKNKFELVQDRVQEIYVKNNVLKLASNNLMAYDVLILATGSKTQYFNWPGQELEGVQGFVSLQDLEKLEQKSSTIEQAVIVGGGLIGVELAEMFTSRNIQTSMIVREEHIWRNILPKMNALQLDKHIVGHGVTLLPDTEIQKINGINGKVDSVDLSNGVQLKTDLVCIATGVTPNIDLVKNTEVETNKGILVNNYLETNIPGIYSIGDCTELRNPDVGRNAIEAVWYTGRKMGETLAKTICGQPTKYSPGHWFNSAKFFDIEYQTYGLVSPGENKHESHFHWINPKNANQFLTIAYHPENHQFLGINTFGIRMRQAYFDSALTHNATVHQVVRHLNKANFEAEFQKNSFEEIQDAFKIKNYATSNRS